MSLPFFYIANIDSDSDTLVLDEDNSRHAVSVLRMQEGEQLHLTDGKGNLLTTAITDPHKKKMPANHYRYTAYCTSGKKNSHWYITG